MILLNQSNMSPIVFDEPIEFDLIYADMVYEDRDLRWIRHWWNHLKANGIFIVQTDWHIAPQVWLLLNYLGEFVNHIPWKNEWGNFPKNRMHQVHDDILVFSSGKKWKFYSERIQVPKVTAKTKLNPSGRQTKTSPAWIDDVVLTTTSKERVKLSDGHLIRWQKPLRLFDRIIAPFSDEGDLIGDPFAGSFTLGEWCLRNNRNYVGVEIDPVVFDLGKQRMEKVEQELSELRK